VEGAAAVEWGPALIALAVGLAGGAFAAWRVWRGGSEAPTDAAVVLRDLHARRDALVAQLREMETAAGKRTPEQLARERYALELDAARVLMEIAGHEPKAAPARAKPGRHAAAAAPAPEAIPAGRPALRGFLWGTGTMAGLGLMLFFVSRSAQERTEGGQLTGNLPGEQRASAAPGGPVDEELARLQAAARQSPDDIEARLALAREHLSRHDMMEVWQETQAVLERVPGEPRALSYQALVRLAMGQGDVAEKMLREALARKPDYVEGYVHLAIVLSRIGKQDAAKDTIERAARLFPREEAALRELWGTIEKTAPDSAAAELADPHSAVAPPSGLGGAGAPPAPAAAKPSGGRSVAGTVDLAPALKGRLRGGTLFVMVREEGFAAGPPIAAKRLAVSSFPVPFEIGAADSMTGEELPRRLLVQARLDSDGDPATRDPADPVAKLDNVEAGAANVALLLESKASR
jgi:cytochrome c-type biogenesis protein CcmH